MANAKKGTLYEYVARDPRGKVIEGKITAPNAEAVTTQLASRGLIPINVEESGGKGLNKEISIGRPKKPKKKDIAVWARQFSIMQDAGLPVVQSLVILEEQTEKETLQDITNDIRMGIEGGKSLSESMREHIDVFGDLIVSMVLAGEEGGLLDETFKQIAIDLEKDVKLRGEIKSAMTYPVVILGLAFILCGAMLIFIVPVFAKMFSDMGGKLPMPTQVLVWLSDFLKVGIVPMIIVGIIFASWWKKNNRKEFVRRFVDPKKLRAPVFGKLVKMIALSRFARNLGTLIGAGVPLLKAIEIVQDTIGNVVISDSLLDVKRSISQGDSMSGPLSQHEVFPPMVTQMVAVGEDAGNLELMFTKIADDYDSQVEQMTKSLASLIEPFMIMFLGIVIGGMVIALYMPIFSVYDLIQ